MNCGAYRRGHPVPSLPELPPQMNENTCSASEQFGPTKGRRAWYRARPNVDGRRANAHFVPTELEKRPTSYDHPSCRRDRRSNRVPPSAVRSILKAKDRSSCPRQSANVDHLPCDLRNVTSVLRLLDQA